MSYSRRKYSDAFSFLADCEEDLLKYEVENSLVLGLANNLAKEILVADEGTFYGSVWKDGVFAGAYLRSSGQRALVLSRMSEEAAAWLAERLEEQVAECQGLVPAVQSFAGAFARRKEQGLRVEMYLAIYRLDDVDGHYPFEAEGMVDGRGLPKPMLRALVYDFLRDCFPNLSAEKASAQADEIVERHLKQGAIFLWRNAESEIVSMAARSRDTLRGATVSLVYTPPQFRRKGYAGRLVAALSRKILDDGKSFCTLSADIQNPTSNSVYAKLGYRKIAESQHLKFVDEELG